METLSSKRLQPRFYLFVLVDTVNGSLIKVIYESQLHTYICVYELRDTRQTIGKDAAVSAYHAYITSLLRYGLILWMNSHNGNNDC